MSARLSAVIANYNYGRFLKRAIDSVLAQTYDPLEIVVVDDGSTDESRDVLARYGTRVTCVLQQNRGQAAALSAGVAASSGDVVAFLDADDAWHPAKARAVVDALERNPRAGWLRHKLELADASLEPLGQTAPRFVGSGPVQPDPRYLLERVVTAATSSIVVRRTALDAVFPLPAQRDFVFDADLLILARLFAAGVPGYSLDRVLGSYRRHDGQQFVDAEDVPAMLSRQLAVACAIAKALGWERDRSVASSKHRAVIAALEGARWWHRSRLTPLAEGIGTALGYADEPKLSARQLSALLFAYATPGLWLRRLERTMPLAEQRGARASR